MTDTLHPKHRSWVMSRIRSSDTKPEILVRSFLHRTGFRFSLRRKTLPGHPDLYLRKYNTVIFIHGCFWHWHDDPNCKRAKIPKSNVSFWEEKLATNRRRDQRNQNELREMGFDVIVLWECAILENTEKALLDLLSQLDRQKRRDYPNMDFRELLKFSEAKHQYLLNKKAKGRRG